MAPPVHVAAWGPGELEKITSPVSDSPREADTGHLLEPCMQKKLLERERFVV